MDTYEQETPRSDLKDEVLPEDDLLPSELLVEIDCEVSTYLINSKNKTKIFLQKEKELTMVRVSRATEMNFSPVLSHLANGNESKLEDNTEVVLICIGDLSYPISPSMEVISPVNEMFVLPLHQGTFYGINISDKGNQLAVFERQLTKHCKLKKNLNLDHKMKAATISVQESSTKISKSLAEFTEKVDKKVTKGKEAYVESAPNKILENSPTTRKAIDDVGKVVNSIRFNITSPLFRASKKVVVASSAVSTKIAKSGANVVVSAAKSVQEKGTEVSESVQQNPIIKKELERRKQKEAERDLIPVEKQYNEDTFSVKSHYVTFGNLVKTVWRSTKSIITGVNEAGEILQESVTDNSLQCVDHTFGEETKNLITSTAGMGLEVYETLDNLKNLSLQLKPTKKLFAKYILENGVDAFESDSEVVEVVIREGEIKKRAQLSEAFWRERWVLLTTKRLIFYKEKPTDPSNNNKNKNNTNTNTNNTTTDNKVNNDDSSLMSRIDEEDSWEIIKLKTINAIVSVSVEDLQINTSLKDHHLRFSSEDEKNEWANAIGKMSDAMKDYAQNKESFKKKTVN